MVLIAWLHIKSTASAITCILHNYGTASNAIWPYGIVVSGYSSHLIVGPSQLTQLCLDFLGAPPYVNYQAINRLKHGFSRAIRAYNCTQPML